MYILNASRTDRHGKAKLPSGRTRKVKIWTLPGTLFRKKNNAISLLQKSVKDLEAREDHVATEWDKELPMALVTMKDCIYCYRVTQDSPED